jgi:Flagellar hook-length control protein FliK
MISGAVRDALVRLLASPAARIEVETDAAPLPARAVGQIVQAKLVADLPNGRSLIDLQGFRLDVKLPVPARPGETLRLEVLALEPKLTFGVLGAQSGPTADPVSMSDSMRRLAALLDGVSSQSDAAPAGRTAPVLPTPTSNAAELAQALERALTRSGLFYESHQAQWVAGERSLDELMREPQAALKRSGEPVHPQASALVQQQIETLDTRQIVWTGQVWPDQPLEWRIEEEQRRDESGSETPSAWKTSLRLRLPQLGELTATLSIAGDEVRMTLAAADADARSALRTGEPVLRAAMERAGLTLLKVAVPEDAAAAVHTPTRPRERGAE